jgi:hypothetical protein
VLNFVRNSFCYASKAGWYQLARDLLAVYTAGELAITFEG